MAHRVFKTLAKNVSVNKHLGMHRRSSSCTSLSTSPSTKLRILFVTSAYNGFSQRLHKELNRKGYDVAIELAVNDELMRKAVQTYRPDLILAPMLKKAIPVDIFTNKKCLILHPGIKGDRGPSSLD